VTDKLYDDSTTWYLNGAGLYVQAEPISAALVAAASTGQAVTKKAGGGLEMTTVSGGGSGATVLYDSDDNTTLPANAIDSGAAGIAGGYDVLEILAILRTDEAVAASTIDLRLNNDSGTHYSYERLTGANTSTSSNQVLSASSWAISGVGASMASGVFHSIDIVIPFYTETVAHKLARMVHGHHDTTAANCSVETRIMRWADTSAITRIAFTAPSTKNFIAGSHVIVYGR
jgi:hypothetical protein